MRALATAIGYQTAELSRRPNMVATLGGTMAADLRCHLSPGSVGPGRNRAKVDVVFSPSTRTTQVARETLSEVPVVFVASQIPCAPFGGEPISR
jgi:hypothetical protein